MSLGAASFHLHHLSNPIARCLATRSLIVTATISQSPQSEAHPKITTWGVALALTGRTVSLGTRRVQNFGSELIGGERMRRKWDLAALRTHIRLLSMNKAAQSSAVSTVNSISRTLELFDYHKCLARDAFIDYHVDNDPTGLKMFAAAMMAGEDLAFEKAKLVSEANLIAVINITRNTYDMFAQLINALILDFKYSIKKCDIWKVSKSLPQGNLKTDLERVVNLPWFVYLNGFSNTIKHRHLIEQQPTNEIDLDGKHRGGGAEVSSFSYDEKLFAGYWVKEVLQGTVEIHNELVGLGITLNEWCLRPHDNH